jgi:hemoglobin-like flavoprotein
MKPSTIALVKATAPVVKEHGPEITQRMYEIAFQSRPDLRRFFVNTWMQNPEEGRKQAQRLAGAVNSYASHIDQIEKLAGPVEHIAQVHVKARIIPEMYPAIGKCLLAAMKEVLGDGATSEVLEAWEEAYAALADIFINRERKIYEDGAKELFRTEESRNT